jgi:hypothetical protein
VKTLDVAIAGPGGCKYCSTDGDYYDGEFSRHRCPEANEQIIAQRHEISRLQKLLEKRNAQLIRRKT